MTSAINAILCMSIIWSIVMYERHGSPYRWFPSVIAYLLCIAAFWQVLRYFAGNPACDSVLTANAVIALGLHQYHGNVAKLIGYRYRRAGMSSVFRFSFRDWRL